MRSINRTRLILATIGVLLGVMLAVSPGSRRLLSKLAMCSHRSDTMPLDDTGPNHTNRRVYLP
jgi:hypothetical protein